MLVELPCNAGGMSRSRVMELEPGEPAFLGQQHSLNIGHKRQVGNSANCNCAVRCARLSLSGVAHVRATERNEPA